MEGMIRKNRIARPPLPLPLPPRSRAPSALVPPMPSQLGRQPQLMMLANVGDGMIRPFPEGLGPIINPQNQYQHPENNPIYINPQNQYQHPENNPILTDLVVSATGTTVGSCGVSSRTESITVSGASGRKPHLGVDDRKLRLLLSNRVSAQKSRLRKANYLNELENQVKELEVMIATFSTEVIVCQERKRLVIMENDLVKQKNAMVEEQLNLKNEEANFYNREITKLQNGFLLQQLPDQTWMSPSPSGPMNYTTNQDMSQPGCPSQNFGMSVPVPVPFHFSVPEVMASQAFQLA